MRAARRPAGVLLMGTVRGDLHDIGKNLVCMMAEGAGLRSPRHRRRPERREVHGRRRPRQRHHRRHERTAHDDDDVHEDGGRRLRGRRQGPHQDGGRRRADQPDVRRRNRRGRLRRQRVSGRRSVPAARREGPRNDGHLPHPLLAGSAVTDPGGRRKRRRQRRDAAEIHRADRCAGRRARPHRLRTTIWPSGTGARKKIATAPRKKWPRRSARSSKRRRTGRRKAPVPVSLIVNGRTVVASGARHRCSSCAEGLGVRVPTSCQTNGKCKECIVEVVDGLDAPVGADRGRSAPEGAVSPVVPVFAAERRRHDSLPHDAPRADAHRARRPTTPTACARRATSIRRSRATATAS